MQYKLIAFLFRQEDRDEENDSSQVDVADKFTQKSAKETSLTSWHTGFHVSLVCGITKFVDMRYLLLGWWS